MRVLISGGGTGGHVYPALAVVKKLISQPAAEQPHEPAGHEQAAAGQHSVPQPSHGPSLQATGDTEVLWVGATNGMEQALVTHAGLRYRGIATGQLRGKNPLTVARNAGRMIAGFLESLAIVREFQPDVCLATGGYVCAPVVAACRLRRVPVMIYLPDMVPGWAIRTLSVLAQQVAVTFPEVADSFGGLYPQGKSIVTGYPVRQELLDAVGGGALTPAAHRAKRQQARRLLATALTMDLCPTAMALPTKSAGQAEVPLILVAGGSQGSLNINNAIWNALPALLPHAQILHVVGNRDWAMWQERMINLPVEASLWRNYHPVAYLHDEMALAIAAADLTVARAGASTLGEFTVARLPAVVAPHPGVNQRQNAEYLVEHGGAVMIEDQDLAQLLVPTLLALINQPERRQAMEAGLAGLAIPHAAKAIADALGALARGR